MGTVDAAIYADVEEILHHPLLAIWGLVLIQSVHAAGLIASALVFSWRPLVALAVCSFSAAHALAYYYHYNPQIESLPAFLILVISVVGGFVLARAVLFIFRSPLKSIGSLGTALSITFVLAAAGSLYRVSLSASVNMAASPRSGIARATGSLDTKPNILLLTLDTLRADHVGAYGYRGGQTPNLDTLANEGVLFERAVAPAHHLTPPSSPASTRPNTASGGSKANN